MILPLLWGQKKYRHFTFPNTLVKHGGQNCNKSCVLCGFVTTILNKRDIISYHILSCKYTTVILSSQRSKKQNRKHHIMRYCLDTIQYLWCISVNIDKITKDRTTRTPARNKQVIRPRVSNDLNHNIQWATQYSDWMMFNVKWIVFQLYSWWEWAYRQQIV